MTPAARCQSALELLDLIDAANGPADALVNGWLRRRRFAGSRDRTAIQALVYGVLRRRLQLNWWCARLGGAATNRNRVRVLLVLASPWPEAESGRAFETDRYGPAPSDEAEMRFAAGLDGAALDLGEQPDHVRHNLPDWLEPSFRQAFGERFAAELAALAGEATVDLRVNTLKTDRDRLIARLADEGLEAAPTPWSPVGLRLVRRRPLRGLPSFREGWFEPQDEGSQLATLLSGAAPGMRVLDLCGGAGGKSLGLAAMMENRGELVIADSDAARLARAGPRLDRAGVTVATCREAGKEGGMRREFKDYFDTVLIDAPCSGTGAWRRAPETRWRLSPGHLRDLTETQSALLETGAGLVRPGGRLVYITCSLLPEENAERIDLFLGQSGTDFRRVRPWPDYGVRQGAEAAGEDVLLTPAVHGTDGFYIAALERAAS